MFAAYYYNLGFVDQETFGNAQQAKENGKSKGFEFYVVQRINSQWVRV